MENRRVIYTVVGNVIWILRDYGNPDVQGIHNGAKVMQTMPSKPDQKDTDLAVILINAHNMVIEMCLAMIEDEYKNVTKMDKMDSVTI